jgi:hypothetical protein
MPGATAGAASRQITGDIAVMHARFRVNYGINFDQWR